MPTPLESVITYAVSAARVLRAEWPSLTAARQPAPSRWEGVPPDSDVSYAGDILGRPMSDEEAHWFSVAFADEWARIADLEADAEDSTATLGA